MFDWKKTYDTWHSQYPTHKSQPIIGITGNFGEKGCELAEGYFRSILEAGGVPMIIPPYEDKDALLSTLDHIDGLLLSGGGDINPLYLGEEPSPALHSINPKRDLPELLLVKLAYDKQIPMLGICRGIQMLVAALDGKLHQDLATDLPDVSLLKHSQDLPREYASHHVTVEEGTVLEQIFKGERELFVNSFHHQAVAAPGSHLKVSAIATDGVIEGVESNEHKSIVGVQWHPECFILRGDRSMMPLFQWLIGEAESYRATVLLHEHILTLDSHCDTPMFFGEDIHFEQRDPKILVDLHKMTEGHLDASIMVAYLPQGERNEETFKSVTAKANELLDGIEHLASVNRQYIGLAHTPDDLYKLKAEGKKAIMMGIENGYAIGHDLSLIEKFHQRGVVYMTLCHNGDNDICDSAKGNAEHGGLSAFGEKVVQEMNRLGIMVDMSHAAESSFYDALEVSQQPFVCSHSSARALCDHPRNLTDEQMKALAQKGGVAQVTMYNGFLRTDGKATILDAVEHLNHMVNIMGIEHVGIGTDFDGDGGIPGMANASEVINFTRRLLQERYSEEQIQMIWGGNFLRVMEQIKNI